MVSDLSLNHELEVIYLFLYPFIHTHSFICMYFCNISEAAEMKTKRQNTSSICKIGKTRNKPPTTIQGRKLFVRRK